MNKEQQEFIESLHEVKVFISISSIFGIPTRVLIAGLLIGGYMVFFLSGVFGALFLLLFFVSMYFIHKDDPEALDIWVRALFGVDYWAAGQPSQISTIIILED